MSSKTIAFHTFGCKVNQVETETLRSLLSLGGYHVVPADQAADVYVVNSCTVTEDADRSCRQKLRKLLRERPSARVIVTGCYVERAADELRMLSPRVEVFGNREKPLVPIALGLSTTCMASAAEQGLVSLADRTRAYIKVQDGCDAVCTYCIVPTVRPVMVSRPPTVILDEARRCLAQGIREMVLTGVRLGRYAWDGDATSCDLTELLHQLVALPGDFRIRLSSLEVTEVSNALLDLAASNPKLCPFFHIPLQSGDDQVLKRMGRWYSAGDFRSRLQDIRSRIPEAALSTDVIVGFPGEDEEQFQKTKQFLEEGAFSRIHVFRYSVRPGTPAERLPQHVSPQTKSQRSQELLALDRHLRHRFANQFLNRPVRVLMESFSSGYTAHYVRVRSRAPVPEGEFRTVQPARIGPDAVLIA